VQSKFIPTPHHFREFKDIDRLLHHLHQHHSLRDCTLIALDLREVTLDWENIDIYNTTLIGCHLELANELLLRKRGANLYLPSDNLPYDPYRNKLYTWQELMEGYSLKADQSTDLKIYQHFVETKFIPPINEALCQRIHDHSIDEALRDILSFDANGMTKLRCVGFMGGHSTLRTDPFFRKTAHTAKLLAENGYYIVSGGGPGIMEAANLGAYLAGRSDEALDMAIDHLGKAPHYKDEGYHQTAVEVLTKYPTGRDNLAIPTWFYGHEPSNLFASHIAKYFSNSIREDTLLAISLYGIVFAPGSAGTTQEIFQDATQNHYGTFNYFSPMVFLGKERYEVDTLIYPLLKQLSYQKEYHDLLYITDDPEGVLSFLQSHPPVYAGKVKD
jgi:predicted Rossmann-fold nucleotide-binding protein